MARAQKKPRGLKNRTRGLNCVCVRFYWVIVTLTVIAGLVTPPEEGVIMTDEVLGAGGPPEQPATSTNTSIAPAIPIRVRKRRTEGIINSRAIASIMKITCRSSADGGTFMDCGGTA